MQSPSGRLDERSRRQRFDDRRVPVGGGVIDMKPNEPLKIIHALVSEQAKDEGLWFIAETAPEGYLQKHLRHLHELVDFLWSMEDDKR